GLAGESGSGKTTLARCIIRLVEPDSGLIELNEVNVREARGTHLRELRRRMQMVFQDPYSSLNPRMTVGAAIHEAGRVHNRPGSENREQFRSEEHTSELQSLTNLVCRLLLEKKNTDTTPRRH